MDKRDKRKKIPPALSELPAIWPGRFSQNGWLGLASWQVTLKGLVGYFFSFMFIFLSKYETIASRNSLSLGYSEQDISSVVLYQSTMNTSGSDKESM